MCKYRSRNEMCYSIRVVPTIPLICRDNVQPTQMADCSPKVSEYNSREEVGSPVHVVCDDEDFGRSDFEM